jgi:hypothetical protein
MTLVSEALAGITSVQTELVHIMILLVPHNVILAETEFVIPNAEKIKITVHKIAGNPARANALIPGR